MTIGLQCVAKNATARHNLLDRPRCNSGKLEIYNPKYAIKTVYSKMKNGILFFGFLYSNDG